MTIDTHTLRASLDTLITKAEDDAAKVERYESEPLVGGILDILDTVPEARDILTPVLAGLTAVSSRAARPAPDSAQVPAQAQTGAPVGDDTQETAQAVSGPQVSVTGQAL